MNSQTPPKGSLEELFRHHLLESEAATVPPRPLVWDHIDNSLLLAQNEKYRRRLLVHRWGMAASLLLAALAGGGWWHSQQAAAPSLATANPAAHAAQMAVLRATTGQRLAAENRTQRTPNQLVLPSEAGYQAPVDHPLPAGAAGYGSSYPTATELAQAEMAYGQPAGASHRANKLAARATRSAGRGYGALVAAAPRHAGAQPGHGAAAGVLAGGGAFSSFTKTQPIGTTATSPADYLTAGTRRGLLGTAANALITEAAADALTPETSADETALLAASPASEATLATRPVALALGPDGALPALALAEVAPLPTATKLRRWQFGVEYAASTFNPNIDFERRDADYNTALSFNTVSATKSAAAEYRANLRAGLGQRLGLRATRWLGGHWSLSTGLEASQQEAYSATSAAFVGEQIPYFYSNSFALSASSILPTATLQRSSFRYRSVGIPVELRYGNPIKPGVSLYGRLGAIVSTLLNVRSEVAGNPEATRTYSFFSASTPYRRLTALLRGSAGIRYRPAHQGWGLHVGPTVEAGVQSMNAETDKSFLQQNRPYSFGLEAGFEFGGGLVPVQ
ncbi:MAG: hypothetical protein EOO56_08510 [Hymenobacter sp.]|nr:MAG: hypothetical protein EOO56_08510 [Hymenobacter sp.]